MQGRADSPVGNNVQEGRLLQFHGECLLQGFVKDGVPRLVVEVGEDNGVFLCQFGFSVGA